MNEMTHESPAETEDHPVMLEGMKILFDDRIGLYPVTLVEAPETGPPEPGRPDREDASDDL